VKGSFFFFCVFDIVLLQLRQHSVWVEKLGNCPTWLVGRSFFKTLFNILQCRAPAVIYFAEEKLTLD